MKLLLLTIFLGAGLAVNAESFRGRIDIVGDAKNAMALTAGSITSGGIIGNASWGKSEERKFYLTAETPLLPQDEWTKFSFSFTPEGDGKVVLVLKSMYAQTKGKKQQDQVWVYWDSLRVDGAVSPGQAAPVVLPIAGDVPLMIKSVNGLVNKSFETIDGKGNAEGWFKNAGAVVVNDKSLAQEGQYFVKVWCTANIAQQIKVKKGGKVTVTGYARPAAFIPAAE